MDAAQQQPAVFHRRWKSDIKIHKLLLLRCCWLLLLGCWCGHMTPKDDTGHPTKNIFSSVHTGKASEHTEYPLC
jgi:hypothetical protein